MTRPSCGGGLIYQITVEGGKDFFRVEDAPPGHLVVVDALTEEPLPERPLEAVFGPRPMLDEFMREEGAFHSLMVASSFSSAAGQPWSC